MFEEQAKARAANSSRKGLKQTASVAFLILTVVSAGATYLTAFATDRLKDVVGVQSSQVAADRNNAVIVGKLTDIVIAMRGDIDNIKRQQRMSSRPSVATQASVRVSTLEAEIRSVQDRQSKLESVILADPSRALALPLMQRDIASEKTTNDAAIVSIKQDVDRIYDLSKWLIGGLTISILSLAFVTFLTRKPPA